MVTGKALVTVASAMVLLWGATATAQVERSGGASAALMQQYQQLTAERTQMQADNEKMKKQLDDLKKQLDADKQQINALKAGSSREHAALTAAQEASGSTEKTLTETKSKMEELIARFRETLVTLRDVETTRTQLQQQLAQSKAAFDQCAVRNDALYQVDNEVLDRYQHQGMFSYLERSDPFTRLKKTQIDNLVLEYRQRAEELRVKPAASRPPVQGTPAAPNPP